MPERKRGQWGITKEDVVASALVAAVSSEAAFLTKTVFLHRMETHRTAEPRPIIRAVGRAATWLLWGVKRREWVGVHLKHHENEDQAADPHSPYQNGRFGVLKVLFGNAPMYRKAAKELTEDEIPAHVKQDKWDRWIFDRGLLGQAALFGTFALAHKGNLKRAALSMAMHDPAIVIGGGVINGITHGGADTFLKSLYNRPVPDEYGMFTRNIPLPGLMAGEGLHRTHHDDPGLAVFSDNPLQDPGGAIMKVLFRYNLAEPGVDPTKAAA